MKTATIITVLAGAAAGVNADVSMSSDPGGYNTFESFYGLDGTAANPSKWFTMDGGQGVSTNWSGQNITFNVTLPANHSPTEDYRLGLTMKNAEGPLPSSYDFFKVKASVNNAYVGMINVAASDDVWNTAWIDIGTIAGLAGDTVPITLQWTNDSYQPGVYDANAGFGGVQVAAIGEPIPAPGAMAMGLASGLVLTRRRRG